MDPLLMLLSLLALTPCTFVPPLLINRDIKMRRPRLFFWLTVCSMMAFYVIKSVMLENRYAALEYLCLSSWILLPLLFAPKGERGYAVLCSAVYLFVQIFSSAMVELAIAPVFSALGISLDYAQTPGSWLYISLVLISLLLWLPLSFFAASVLNAAVGRSKLRHETLLFLPIPFSQCLLVLASIQITVANSAYLTKTQLYLALGALLLNALADTAYFMGLRRLKQTSLLKDSIEHALDTQTAHYAQLQEHIIEVRKLKHDMKNQLLTAYILMESGENEQARTQLDSLSRALEEH